jgi:hypothetical protein
LIFDDVGGARGGHWNIHSRMVVFND